MVDRLPEANVGVATGDGLIVLDLDSEGAIVEAQRRGLPSTVEVRTSKGRHLYFRGEGDCRTGFLPGVDIRGQGGYVVAPPSVHASGEVYEWIHSFTDTELAPAPGWILESTALESQKPATSPISRGALEEGTRNDGLYRFGCAMRQTGLDEFAIEGALIGINANRCDPPLEDDEVTRIAQSAAKSKPGGRYTPLPDDDKALLALKLGPHANSVYLALRTFANGEGQCFPSLKTIADRAGVGRSKTSTCLATLVDVGLIYIENRGLGNSNLYTLFPVARRTDAMHSERAPVEAPVRHGASR